MTGKDDLRDRKRQAQEAKEEDKETEMKAIRANEGLQEPQAAREQARMFDLLRMFGLARRHTQATTSETG